MSTEAMELPEDLQELLNGILPARAAFLEGRILKYREALIKAALDAAAEKCEQDTFVDDYGKLYTSHKSGDAGIAEAIRQITPQQVMERMK